MNIKITLSFLLAILLGTPMLCAMETTPPDPKMDAQISLAGAQTFERIMAQIKNPTKFQEQHVETLIALAAVHQNPEGQLKEAVKHKDVNKAKLCLRFLPQDQPKWELLNAVRDYQEENAKFLLQFTDASDFYIHTVDDKEARESDPHIQAAPITLHFSWQDDHEDTLEPYSFWATYGMTKLLLQNGCKLGKGVDLGNGVTQDMSCVEYSRWRSQAGKGVDLAIKNVQKLIDIAAEQKDGDYYEELIRRHPREVELLSLRDAIERNDLDKADFCMQHLALRYPDAENLIELRENLVDSSWSPSYLILRTPKSHQDLKLSSYQMTKVLYRHSGRNSPHNALFLARMAMKKIRIPVITKKWYAMPQRVTNHFGDTEYVMSKTHFGQRQLEQMIRPQHSLSTIIVPILFHIRTGEQVAGLPCTT